MVQAIIILVLAAAAIYFQLQGGGS